jgi:large subunit ribosomal protein L23
MGLFNKKKTEDDKKTDEKSVKIDNEKKESAKSMKDLYGEKKNNRVKVGAEKEKAGKKKDGNAYRILIKPLVTEKASRQGADNKYFFAVAKDANKIEIAKAINEVYGVKPVSVNIINMGGKSVRSGKTSGKRKSWKKAIVKLKTGESIKVYEGV